MPRRFTINEVNVNGELRRASACVLVCLGLVFASACGESQPERAPSSTLPPVSSSATPSRTIGGTAFYLESKGAILEVHAVRGGSEKPVSIVADTGPCPFNTAVISPDGSQIAWAATTGASGAGNLVVSDLRGANRRTLPVGASCGGRTSLIWFSPTAILVRDSDDTRRQVLHSATTGEPLGDVFRGVWSANGEWAATTDGSGEPIVMPKGSPGAARRFTFTPPSIEAKRHDGWSVRSVSHDGRYVSVGWNSKDQRRDLGSFAVVDTGTSKVVNLPVSGEVSSVHFLADRTALVRIGGGKLVLLDERFTELAHATEPASVSNLPLLWYATT